MECARNMWAYCKILKKNSAAKHDSLEIFLFIDLTHI